MVFQLLSLATQESAVPWGLPVCPIQSQPICFHANANGGPRGHYMWPHLGTGIFSKGACVGHDLHMCVIIKL